MRKLVRFPTKAPCPFMAARLKRTTTSWLLMNLPNSQRRTLPPFPTRAQDLNLFPGPMPGSPADCDCTSLMLGRARAWAWACAPHCVMSWMHATRGSSEGLTLFLIFGSEMSFSCFMRAMLPEHPAAMGVCPSLPGRSPNIRRLPPRCEVLLERVAAGGAGPPSCNRWRRLSISVSVRLGESSWGVVPSIRSRTMCEGCPPHVSPQTCCRSNANTLTIAPNLRDPGDMLTPCFLTIP
mmetsp:Transcript_45563/g.87123  ORF Transcript_45563/g.87123 Transcript_45563/m.87123 type:complete len:237 (-) Transcript_45563:50-760(-)